MVSKCFGDLHWQTFVLLKTKEESSNFFNLRLKTTSWACLFGSGLKLIFLWNAQLITFFKSLFNSLAELLMPCTTMKRDLSSGKNFALEVKSLDKSFIQIKNYNGPIMTPWMEFLCWHISCGFFTIRNNYLFSIIQEVR